MNGNSLPTDSVQRFHLTLLVTQSSMLVLPFDYTGHSVCRHQVMGYGWPMSPKRLPWLKLRKKTDPELPTEPPIMLGNRSNGEFFHEQTPRERKIREEILKQADDKARYLGLDRREFLASAMGMATSLSVLNMAAGCGSGSSGTGGSASGAGRDGGMSGGDGGYDIPPDATVDCDMANEMLSGDEFIVDMQTHHLVDEERWRETRPPDMPFPGGSIDFTGCTDGVACTDQHAYIENIFLNSDTTVAVLSGVPSPILDNEDLITSQISNEDMVHTRQWINDAAGSQRVIQHCQVAPNDNWDRQSAMMERIREQWGNHGWKCYPPWSPEVGPGGEMEGWWLDSDTGTRFIERAVALGEPIVCIHKGFPFPSWSREKADPQDIGPAAAQFPDVKFIVYHSAYQDFEGLGPYPETGPVAGPDRLVRTVLDHGLTGKNVYAEMGSAWVLVMNSPDAAQHYVGKMLKYIGEDRLLWGSECVWFGSPQPQIEAFRKLTISKEFQDRYGYPELTQERKRKILGLNAAKLYGLDPSAVRCTVNVDKLARMRRNLDGEFGGRRWAFQKPFGPRTRREFFQLGRVKAASGEPG